MMMAAERALDLEMQSVRRAPVLSVMPTMIRRRTFLAGLAATAALRRDLFGHLRGLGQDCQEGYFYEEGAGCLVQTQQLANTYVNPVTGQATFLPPTQYYEGIYGPSVSPVGKGSLNLQPLDPAVRAAIEAAGHTIDCKKVCDEYCMSGPFGAEENCCSELCSVDGSGYDRGAYAINANPGVLLVELGARAPLFPATTPAPTAPGAVPQVPQPTVTQPGTVAAKALAPATTPQQPTHVMTQAAGAALPAVLTTPISIGGMRLSPLLFLAAGVGVLLLTGRK